MNVALWVVQALAAVAFAFHGNTLTFRRERARARIPWARALPDALLAIIGVAEIAGAIALILPPLIGVATWLTPLAASALVVLMLFAMVFHAARREWPNIALNVALAAAVAFVAYGRAMVVPFS